MAHVFAGEVNTTAAVNAFSHDFLADPLNTGENLHITNLPHTAGYDDTAS